MAKMSNILTLTTILISVAIFSSSSSACNEEDKTALIAFKSSFPAKYFTSWTASTDCCTWEHIGCDDNTGRVTSLSMSHNTGCDDLSCSLPLVDLHGSIPASIGDITNLQTIFFDVLPNLVGPIPPQLSNLKQLQSLTIYKTGVSGSIPSSLAQLASLTSLDLSNNKLCGKIPSGGQLAQFGAEAYVNNKCLCGAPLPACN